MLITTKNTKRLVMSQYFTINERNKIEILLKENYFVNKIDKIIGVHRSTIYRKIKRYSFYTVYSTSRAQKIFYLILRKKEEI